MPFSLPGFTTGLRRQPERRDMMNAGGNKPEEVCSCGELHKGHICWLSQMGLWGEVRHLTSSPTVTCRKCGARANLGHNVCFPEPLLSKGPALPT